MGTRMAPEDERRFSRTAKSCGPDASRRTSACGNNSAGDGDKKAHHRGEHEGNLKTIARGIAERTGTTVVTNSCAFTFCTRGCGPRRAPGIPAPSLIGRWLLHNSAYRAARSRTGADLKSNRVGKAHLRRAHHSESKIKMVGRLALGPPLY